MSLDPRVAVVLEDKSLEEPFSFRHGTSCFQAKCNHSALCLGVWHRMNARLHINIVCSGSVTHTTLVKDCLRRDSLVNQACLSLCYDVCMCTWQRVCVTLAACMCCVRIRTTYLRMWKDFWSHMQHTDFFKNHPILSDPAS